MLVLALFAALIAPYFIDWTSYRTAFEAEASRIIGQPVKVHGDADARLLPFPSVTFSDVTVGGDAQPAMTISRFSMDAELAPFLSGEVLIFDMRIEAPKAVVRILEDGTLDWALKRKPARPGDLVVLENVSIKNADITVVDEQNGRTHRLRGINAQVSAGSLSGPWSIEAEGEIEGHRGGVSISTGSALADGSIRMRMKLAPDEWPVLLEAEGEARIKDNKPLYDGLFTFTALSSGTGEGANPARPLIVAKGDFAATDERLAIEEWRAEIGLSDDPYVVTGQATIDTGPDPDFLLIADGQQIDMDRLGEEQADAGENSAPVPLEQRLALLNTLINRLPPPPLPGRISLILPAIVAGDTTLREIRLNARPDGNAWLIDKFSANLPGRTTVEARGRLMSGASASFDGTLTVASTQPSGLANWLVGDVDPVIRRLNAAGFSANVSLSAQLQRFEALEIAVGPAILKGRMERHLPAEGAPSLSIELAGDTFDVDAVRALALLVDADGGAVGPLTDYNVAARLKADILTVGDYQIGGVDTSFFWRDQRLTVENMAFADLAGASGAFTAALAGPLEAPSGTVDGQVSAESAAGLFELADRLSGGHALVRRLAANSFAFDDLSAKLKLDLAPDSGPELTLEGQSGGSGFSLRASGTGLRPGGDGPRTVSLDIDNPEAYRILEQAGFAVLPYEGEGPAALKLNVSGGADNGDLAIDATFTSGSTVLSLDGNGAMPAAGPLTGLFSLGVESGDIEPFAVMFGLSLPQVGVGLPASLTARLAMNGEQSVLSEIDGAAGGNGFSGQLSFDRSASPLAGTGALHVERADLEWLSALSLGPSLTGSDGATWSSEPFLPPALDQPDMQIVLKADLIELGRAGSARNFTSELTTGAGVMILANAEADWFGGRLGGNLSLTNANGSVFLSGRVSSTGVDLAAVERAIRGSAVLSGGIDISASVEGTGKSMGEVAASLAGGGELAANDLVINEIDPGAFARILGAADREGFKIETDTVGDMVAGFMTGGEMRAKSLALPFTLTGGVMRFSTAEIDGERARLAGDARVDLLGLKLESDWRLSFEPGVEAIAGGDPSVVFALAGLLVDPALSIDATQMTNYLSMRAFERERRKVELLQAGVVEKQRLRREVALLKERAAQRKARAEAEQAAQRAIEEINRQAQAEAAQLAEEQARQAAEAEAAAKAAEKVRAEQQAIADEQARREAAEQAARLAEENVQKAREAEAAAAAKTEAQRAAEEAAREKARQAPAVERRTLPDPVADPPSALANEPPPQGLPELQFEDLPGVNDPIRSLIAPDG
ncbi:AsmA family protein [Hoeflea sp. G2-23]|uniref:AsmA family protein n=1 Tax=Hoeflea algicola TaxID=2983763 RepID=A0ABT3Z4J9_9HYPH|nr:AsmA family protein [Hoeflea algicola]